MEMIQVGRRFALVMMVLIGTVLAGCASPVSIDPTRTSMLFAHSASPGADGMTTTETKQCDLKRQLTKEEADMYLKDPAKAIEDDICIFKKENRVVQGSPSLGGQMALGATNAMSGGIVNYAVQNALQRQQQEFCKRNDSCGNKGTSIQNLVQTQAQSVNTNQVEIGVNTPACAAAGNCGK